MERWVVDGWMLPNMEDIFSLCRIGRFRAKPSKPAQQKTFAAHSVYGTLAQELGLV